MAKNYCSINKAFNNNFKNKIKEFDTYAKQNKIDLQDSGGYFKDPNSIDNDEESLQGYNSNFNIQQNYVTDNAHPFFTTQGDFNKIGYKNDPRIYQKQKGSTLSEVQQRLDDNDSISLSDLDSVSEDNNSIKESKKIMPHKYYIKKFIQNIVDDDIMSMTSSQDEDVYHHLNSCKPCRTQINQKLKSYHNKQKTKSKERKIVQYNSFNSDIKEIIVVILVGIIIIFIIDLFVKIGKKMV